MNEEEQYMNLVKCPRCDLNYILDTEKLCKVCLREMKGNHVDDDMELNVKGTL